MGLIVNHKKTKYMIISVAQKGRQMQNLIVGDKYSVIQKGGLNFARPCFLNYTCYVNDLHNI